MGITSIETDYDDLSLTLIAHFEACVDRVWALWSDPRELERWWGPPGYPAVFETHDLVPGGEATYVMTGPEGTMRGTWRVTAVDPPNSLEFTDAFSGPQGQPLAETPFRVRVSLSESGGGTQMEMRFSFGSLEDMTKLADTGLAEGLREAVDQIEPLLR